jgi:hypothetical protein
VFSVAGVDPRFAARLAAPPPAKPEVEFKIMSDIKPDDGTVTYAVREAVGVFESADALEAAVDKLEASGFNRAVISVLASDKVVRERLGRLYRSVNEIVDDPRAPLAIYVPQSSRVEGEAALVGVPLYIGGLAGGLAVVASGGAMALAFAAAIGVGAVGAGLGGLLVRVVAHRHIHRVREQLAQGGLVLWVSVRDNETAAHALAILIDAGARDSHLHEIEREWTLKDRPFALAQPDPFLEADPASS